MHDDREKRYKGAPLEEEREMIARFGKSLKTAGVELGKATT